MLNFSNPIILASKSPRRHELLLAMGVNFTIQTLDTDESYPSNLKADEIAAYIARKKANAFPLDNHAILITADTIVALKNEILGKPKNKKDAENMLKKLSGQKHEVFTGICIRQGAQYFELTDRTEVYCNEISDDEVDFYIENFQPFDKAGSYGIQDWFGLTIVEQINGSYTNVMGLPTEKLYRFLKNLAH